MRILGMVVLVAGIAAAVAGAGPMPLLIPLLIGLIAFVVYDARKESARADPVMRAGGRSSRPTVWTLARVEGRRLLMSPVFMVGLGFAALATLLVGQGFPAVMHRDDLTFTLFMFPVAGMVLIAVNLAVSRSRRDGTDEFFDALPAGRDTRTLAHLVSVAWVVAVAVVVIVIQVAVAYANDAISTPDVGELLTGPMLVACAGIVGVSAARLVPSSAIGVIAVVLMGIFQGTVDHFAGPVENATNWFAPWVPDADFWAAGDLLPRRAWLHLVYLIGLGGFAAVIGFLRHRRDRGVWTAMGLVLAVVAAGGIAQSRPYSDATWDRAGAMIADPSGYQSCETIDAARFCAYDGYEGLIAGWAEPVNGVLRAVPSAVRARGLEVRQRIEAREIWHMPIHVRGRLPQHVPTSFPRPWADDIAIHPGMNWCGAEGSCQMALATLTAAWSVGLPTAAGEAIQPGGEVEDPFAPQDFKRYDAGGEARAIVALWLGARSTGPARAHFLARLARPMPIEGDADAGTDESVPIEGCEGVAETGTLYASSDLQYAGMLLALPDTEVLPVLSRHWDRLTDPDTPSSEVGVLFVFSEPEPLPGVFSNC